MKLSNQREGSAADGRPTGTASTTALPEDGGRLQLGSFVLDLAAGELLTGDARPAALRRQALDVLLVLARRAGRVVSKDELMRLVWPDVVVGEGSLTQAIADVRRALGDAGHRLVRNVARRGYRLQPDPAPDDAPTLSIAVMPFEVVGDPESSGWLADALHGDLVTEMARLFGSVVIARDTAATYKGKPIDPRRLARELRVRHIVQGSLRLEGDRIRLNLALVEGESGMQCWAEPFVVERSNLPPALAELAGQIVRVLQPQLVRAVVARRAALSALEISADELAMRAQALWFRSVQGDNIVEALKLLERAVALDPDSIRGWGGLGFMNLHGMLNGWLPDRAAALCRIDEAAAQLERLDAEGPYTYQTRAIQAFLRSDWPALIRITTAWIALSRPPAAFAARGLALLLTGDADCAVADLQQALRLSPRDSIRAEWQYRLAMAHFAAGRWELAHDWAQTAAESNPAVLWPPVHAAALERLGRTDEARQAFALHMARHPAFVSALIAQRLPGGDPTFAEARDRLASSLRALGMR